VNIKHSDLAAALGVSKAAVSQWLTGRPPVDRCPFIERATAGRVTCDELRSDVRWHRISDPAWPHPDGRPCLDIAAPTQQAA
jgi:DNA-binding transcriptional regulator YdaS (Cro superfamily)